MHKYIHNKNSTNSAAAQLNMPILIKPRGHYPRRWSLN